MFLRDFFNRFGNAKKDIECKELSGHAQTLIVTDKSYVDDLEEEIGRLKKEKIKLKKKKSVKLTDLVSDVFCNSESDLSTSEVLARVSNGKLRNKKNAASIKSTIYYLVNTKRLERGQKKGTFRRCSSAAI